MLHFVLTTTKIVPVQVGAENAFYLKYLYKIKCEQDSTAIGNIFITPRGLGSGVLYLNFNDQKEGLYISCFCSYVDAKLVYHTGSIIGGHGIYQDFTGGNVSFQNTRKLIITVEPNIEKIFKYTTLTQNYIMTNKVVYTTEIESGNPNTIFRVGSFDVTDLNNELPVAKFYFTSYDETLTRGFGSHLVINEQQILFSYYLSAYLSSIFEPDTLVKSVNGALIGGQKYAKYIKTGIFTCHTFPPSLNEKYSYFYREQEQFNPFRRMNVLALNRKTTVIPTEDVFGTIRFGYFELYNPSQELIGYLYFSTFLTDKKLGFGQGVFVFNDNNNLYYTFQNNPENPLDPDSFTKTTGCLTGGNGTFRNLSWGETNWTPISSTSSEIVIVY